MTGGERRDWRAHTYLAGLLGLALLGLALLLGSLTEGAPRILPIVIAGVGCALLCAAVLAILLAPVVERIWTGHLTRAQGLAVVDTVPPADVMQRLLARVYGEHEANEQVAQTLLGGAGHDLAGGDLSLAAATTVHMRLESAVPGSFYLTTTVDYSFPRPVLDRTLTIFETSDARLRDIIVVGCERPLFDWSYYSDPERWRHSREESHGEIAITFLDESGTRHQTELQPVRPAWVPYEEWSDHFALFRRAVRSRPRRDPRQYLSSLRIFTVELAALAPAGVTVTAIVGLMQRSVTLHTDVGNSYWQPPFPCLLQDITVDATDFREDESGQAREFTLHSFLSSAQVEEPRNWVKAEDLAVVRVGTWALPGNGFILLWRTEQNQDGN